MEYLIDASNKLEQNEIDHKLIIAGDNTDPRFQKYIQRLQNISNKNVYFLGKINEKEKEFYQNLDIFILPSINSLESIWNCSIRSNELWYSSYCKRHIWREINNKKY